MSYTTIEKLEKDEAFQKMKKEVARLTSRVSELEQKVDSHTKDIELDDNRIRCISSRVFDLEYAARKKETPKTPEYSLEIKKDGYVHKLCIVTMEEAMAEIKKRPLSSGEHIIMKLL